MFNFRRGGDESEAVVLRLSVPVEMCVPYLGLMLVFI